MSEYPYKAIERWEAEERQKEIDKDVNWVLSDGKLMFRALPKKKVKNIILKRDKYGQFTGGIVE